MDEVPEGNRKRKRNVFLKQDRHRGEREALLGALASRGPGLQILCLHLVTPRGAPFGKCPRTPTNPRREVKYRLCSEVMVGKPQAPCPT